MDLSREYIKMCAEAREIQKKWIPKLGDFLWLGPKYICDESACRVLCDILSDLDCINQMKCGYQDGIIYRKCLHLKITSGTQ